MLPMLLLAILSCIYYSQTFIPSYSPLYTNLSNLNAFKKMAIANDYSLAIISKDSYITQNVY